MQPHTERIGILGGTFNPIHIGHLIIAQNALEACDLHRVLFLPCATPPHKDSSTLAPAKHRTAMIEASIEDDPRFDLCDIELKRKGPSYSIDTITQLKTAHPLAELFFIIGSDTLMELHMWKDIYRLLDLCTFITFARPGAGVAGVEPAKLKLKDPWPERLLRNLKSWHQFDVSSSDIRHRIAEGLSIRYLVCQRVGMYISEHHLYAR